MSDRIVLKLDHGPQWLTEEEIDWLVQKSNITLQEIHLALSEAKDTYALTKIFDPGNDDPKDKELRRARMERFRKRQERAREKMRLFLKEGNL